MVDLSNLSQEKRAFLKVNPELLRSLEKAIPLQVGKVQARKEKLMKGKSKLQRDLETVEGVKRKAEEARSMAAKLRREHMLDPNLREINKQYQGLLEKSESESTLICPTCGEGDKGNRMNRQPWCMKCNTALIPRKTLKKWRKLPEIKFAPNALRDELHRLNPGLNPDNKEEVT